MASVRKKPAENTEFSYIVDWLGVRPNNANPYEVLRWLNTKVAPNDVISF